MIGDLQSTWGVPPYPQEYRITLKVAEEREQREPRAEPSDGDGTEREKAPARNDQPRREKATGDQPRREKAPAAPGVTAGGTREKAPRKRRRRRRRGGGGQNGGGSGDGSQGGPPQQS